VLNHSRILQTTFNILITLALLLGSASDPTPAQADSAITVETIVDTISADGLCSLREAITNANDNSQTYTECVTGSTSDTIHFNDTLGTATILLNSNLPSITDSYGLTIDGGGHITISGNDLYQVFNVSSSSTLTLQSLSVTHGKSSIGGGVQIWGSSTLIVIDSNFSNNASTTHGGGIFNEGTLTITNSIFTNNSAAGAAGGISNQGGIANIKNSTFANNTAASGAGIYTDDAGSLTVSNSTFFDNTATNYGGGIYSTGTTSIINNSFSSNGAGISGSDIYFSTFSNPVFSLKNNILANSDTSVGNCTLNSGLVLGNNNLIESTGALACNLTNGVDGNIIGPDPALGSITGSPAYFPLNAGSPAIDAGDNTVCAAAPVYNQSQNGLVRPQGGKCDIGSFEKDFSSTFKSSAANDGWILESSENRNTGGTMNSAATTITLGDDAADRQYRSILHFDTSSLPDTAVVTNMTLKIKQQGNVTGVSPFTFGSLYVDMRNPAFGNSILELVDFSFAAKKVKPAVFNPNPVSGWFSARFNTGGKLYVNRTGVTQLRLYFSVDDNNNNIADFIRFYSGNASAGDRPKLLITYYLP
jgi:CSLREA domain-containing protein